MDDVIMKKLYEKFNLSTRQGTGGMTFKYVPNEDVINRMNEVFGGAWSTHVKFRDIVDDQVILEVEVIIVDPGTDMCHSHTGFGSQQIMRYNSGPNQGKIIDIGNAYKGALAKAIVNACTRWGVGLFKESNPTDGSASVEMPAVPSQLPPMHDSPVITPPSTATVPMPAMPTTAVAPAVMPPPATAAPTMPVEVPMVPMPPIVAPPVVETTTTFPPPQTPQQPISAHINVAQEVVPPLPKIPAPVMDAVPPITPEVPFSTNDGGLGSVKISDVQKVALNGILTMNSAEYAPLAVEAFEANNISKPVPNREDLNYEEAVVVIKFGNEKFRKNR